MCSFFSIFICESSIINVSRVFLSPNFSMKAVSNWHLERYRLKPAITITCSFSPCPWLGFIFICGCNHHFSKDVEITKDVLQSPTRFSSLNDGTKSPYSRILSFFSWLGLRRQTKTCWFALPLLCRERATHLSGAALEKRKGIAGMSRPVMEISLNLISYFILHFPMPIDPPIPTQYNNLELCKLTLRKFYEIGTFLFKS